MFEIHKTNRWRSSAVGWISGVGLFIAATIVSGQPMYAPPRRITVEAAAEKLGGPTLVTLKLTDAAPSAILESLTAQTGLTFDEYSVREQLADLGKVSVDYQAKPVWHVLRDLTSKLDVSLRPYDYPRFSGDNNGVSMRVELGKDPDLHGPVCESGPVVVIASRVARSVSLAPSPTSPGIQRVVLELTVLVDPKIRTRGKPDGYGLEIHDDQGRPLEVEATPEFTWTREVVSHSPLIWKVTAWARLTDVSVKKLNEVSGVLQFVTTTASQPWEVKDVLQVDNAAKNIAGTSFVVGSVVPWDYAGPAFAVTLRSWGRGEEFDAGWPLRSMFDRVSAVQLLDASGTPLYPYYWKEQENRDFVIIFKTAMDNSDGKGDPATLVWDLPTEVSEIEVPFKFTDIPLP